MQTVLLPVDLIGQVSDRALILYALMADRAKSSATRPQFIDSDGLPFVIFTVDEVSRRFGIGHTQAKLSFKELETVGLIVGKCQGMGQPKHYYVKTDGKPSVKTDGKPSANQLDHNQSEHNQSSDDDTAIKQIVDDYRKLPQFADITPDIADFVVKNVKNASKKRKIANIKAYIRTCLMSAPADYAAHQLATTSDSGYSATYDIAEYERYSIFDDFFVVDGHRVYLKDLSSEQIQAYKAQGFVARDDS